MLKERLISSSWSANLKAQCKALIQQRGADNVTVEELVHKLAPQGRASVPGSVKAEILEEMKKFLGSLS
jgi:Transcription factor e(y)2